MLATLYQARVFHRRLRPKAHTLAYNLWALRVDLSALDDLAQRHLLGGQSPLSLEKRDFGPRDGSDLLTWAQTQLREDGPIDFTFLPRWKGRGFSPISVYSTERSALFEVHNTAGEAHSYLIPRTSMAHVQAWKRLWVSPFSQMHGAYDFVFQADAKALDLRVTLRNSKGPILKASLTGLGEPLSLESLAKVRRAPGLVGRRTFAAILWEAVKLRAKGLRPHWGPFAPAEPVTKASLRLDAKNKTPHMRD